MRMTAVVLVFWILRPFSQMRSEAFPFIVGGLWGWTCVGLVCVGSSFVVVLCTPGVVQFCAYGKFRKRRQFWMFHASHSFVSLGRGATS